MSVLIPTFRPNRIAPPSVIFELHPLAMIASKITSTRLASARPVARPFTSAKPQGGRRVAAHASAAVSEVI